MARGSLIEFLADFRGQEVTALPRVVAPATEAAEGAPSLSPAPRARLLAPSPALTTTTLPASNLSPATAEPGRPPAFRQYLGRFDEFRTRTIAFMSDASVDSWLDRWVENRLATSSMFLGLASMLLPILAVPSVILAVVCLRRLPDEPWRKGKARSLAGIVASVVLAPLSLALWLTLL